jgi:hypothetical protein
MQDAYKFFAFIFTVLLFVLSGCSHALEVKVQDPQKLLDYACGPGGGISAIKGSVWLKTQSKEVSGQFPALVDAHAKKQTLILEVTNLIGGTEALISVVGQKYTISVPSQPNKKHQIEQGQGTWGGIPLQWSTDLFLGRIPCPLEKDPAKLAITASEEGDLTIETRSQGRRESERYVYQFRQWEGVPWPEALHWERTGSALLSVDFKFDDPEDTTRSPRKWEAKSPRGEVKVRWKDRKVVVE